LFLVQVWSDYKPWVKEYWSIKLFSSKNKLLFHLFEQNQLLCSSEEEEKEYQEKFEGREEEKERNQPILIKKVEI